MGRSKQPEALLIDISKLGVKADLEELGPLMGAVTYGEAVRRMIIYQLALQKLIRDSKTVIVHGKNPKGRDEYITMP